MPPPEPRPQREPRTRRHRKSGRRSCAPSSRTRGTGSGFRSGPSDRTGTPGRVPCTAANTPGETCGCRRWSATRDATWPWHRPSCSYGRQSWFGRPVPDPPGTRRSFGGSRFPSCRSPIASKREDQFWCLDLSFRRWGISQWYTAQNRASAGVHSKQPPWRVEPLSFPGEPLVLCGICHDRQTKCRVFHRDLQRMFWHLLPAATEPKSDMFCHRLFFHPCHFQGHCFFCFFLCHLPHRCHRRHHRRHHSDSNHRQSKLERVPQRADGIESSSKSPPARALVELQSWLPFFDHSCSLPFACRRCRRLSHEWPRGVQVLCHVGRRPAESHCPRNYHGEVCRHFRGNFSTLQTTRVVFGPMIGSVLFGGSCYRRPRRDSYRSRCVAICSALRKRSTHSAPECVLWIFFFSQNCEQVCRCSTVKRFYQNAVWWQKR
mmetsp:Transcript_7829/g.23020  ORF Transcript_7829/g.23020 Transcript_7829/m.23020 type:complete len:432 (+) Transcript_7829:761-2056(+)